MAHDSWVIRYESWAEIIRPIETFIDSIEITKETIEDIFQLSPTRIHIKVRATRTMTAHRWIWFTNSTTSLASFSCPNEQTVRESVFKSALKLVNGTKMAITKLHFRHLFKKLLSGRISMDQILRHLVAWALFSSGKLSDVNLKFILLQQDSCLNWFASALTLTNQNSTICSKIMLRLLDLFTTHQDMTSFPKVTSPLDGALEALSSVVGHLRR